MEIALRAPDGTSDTRHDERHREFVTDRCRPTNSLENARRDWAAALRRS